MITIVLSLIFGFLGGVIGAFLVEAYLQRRATDVVSEYGAPIHQQGKRRAG